MYNINECGEYFYKHNIIASLVIFKLYRTLSKEK